MESASTPCGRGGLTALHYTAKPPTRRDRRSAARGLADFPAAGAHDTARAVRPPSAGHPSRATGGIRDRPARHASRRSVACVASDVSLSAPVLVRLGEHTARRHRQRGIRRRIRGTRRRIHCRGQRRGRVDRSGRFEPLKRITKPGLLDRLIRCQRDLADLAALLRQDEEEPPNQWAISLMTHFAVLGAA